MSETYTSIKQDDNRVLIAATSNKDNHGMNGDVVMVLHRTEAARLFFHQLATDIEVLYGQQSRKVTCVHVLYDGFDACVLGGDEKEWPEWVANIAYGGMLVQGITTDVDLSAYESKDEVFRHDVRVVHVIPDDDVRRTRFRLSVGEWTYSAQWETDAFTLEQLGF